MFGDVLVFAGNMSISFPSHNTNSESWSISEQLNLALAVVKSGDQNWGSISRAMNPLSGRPSDWYSQKNCALQYKLLLEQIDSIRRKKMDGTESTAELVVRYLRTERIKEIETIIIKQKEEIRCIEEDLEILKQGSGASKDQIDKIAQRVLKENNFALVKKCPEKIRDSKETSENEPLSEKCDENNVIVSTTTTDSTPTSPYKIPPPIVQKEEEPSSLPSNTTNVEIKTEVEEEVNECSVKSIEERPSSNDVEIINQSQSIVDEKYIPEEEEKEVNKENDKSSEILDNDPKEEEKVESTEVIADETLVKSEVEEENEDSESQDPKEPSGLEENQAQNKEIEETNEGTEASVVEETVVENTPSPQTPCGEDIRDTEDSVNCSMSEEQDKIVNVEETTNSESSNLSEEEEKTSECCPEKENKMEEKVSLDEKEDESSSPMIEDSVLSKKENTVASTAKPVIIEITKPLYHSQKEDKQLDHESLESDEIVKSKRSTRATIKKENEPFASKSSGEDADIEDSIKITRRKNKRMSEKQQNPDEESATPNPSSNSKRKSGIKVEEETAPSTPPVENVIENRRLSRVKDEVISGPILTRGSRRGSSRSSSPTGSVILNEEVSELSEPRTRTSTRRKSGKVTPAESEHESVPPSPAPSEEEHTWKKSAFSALEDIKSCNYHMLETPGDPLGIVKRPFDLSSIHKSLENGVYKTLPEFQRDIQLLLLNMVIVVPYSSEVYDQFHKIQQDINQIMSSLINNTISLTKPVASSKRKRTSSILSATDTNSSCSIGSSSKSKRRKTRGDD